MCPEGSQARPHGTVPQGCGPRVRGTCAAHLVHPRSESGLQHQSSPCWVLPTPLATRPRPRAQQEVGLPWFPPDTSHPPSHILSLTPGRLHKGPSHHPGESSGLFWFWFPLSARKSPQWGLGAPSFRGPQVTTGNGPLFGGVRFIRGVSRQ